MVISWLPTDEICSPEMSAIFLTVGIAPINWSIGIFPASYPALSDAAPAPAMVPPVARMITFGSCALTCKTRTRIVKEKVSFS
jgi:hypothetical protein